MIARAPTLPSLLQSSRLGPVSIPDGSSAPTDTESATGTEFHPPAFDRGQARTRLLALGRDLGLTVAAEAASGTETPAGAAGSGAESSAGLAEPVADATDDADRAFLADLDEATRKGLEGLDAVWLQGGEVVAAFVVEARPGWEGLRKLADLLAIHPKLKAPLYAVTVGALRDGLLAEVHRPVYRLLKRPLSDQLRFLDLEKLGGELDQLGERVRYLKPAFLEGIAERLSLPAAD